MRKKVYIMLLVVTSRSREWMDREGDAYKP
jgi:hypothetical protein